MFKKNKVIWMGINIALLFISICVVPPILKISTAKIYKSYLKNQNDTNYNDFEPVIVKKIKEL